MSRSTKISLLVFIFGAWSLLAADTIKDFYFEMKARSNGEIINYSNLSEFCGITGDKRPNETEFAYSIRRVRGMATAIIAMSFLSVIFFGLIGGIILGIFYLFGAFKEEEI